MRNPLIRAATLVLLVSSVAACGPGSEGSMGITRSPSGELMGVVELCDLHPVGAAIYPQSPSGVASAEPHAVGYWTFPAAATRGHSYSWPLFSRAGSVSSSDLVPESLTPGRYVLQGASEDADTVPGSLSFTSSQIESLKAGTYLYTSSSSGSPTSGTLEQFRRDACP